MELKTKMMGAACGDILGSWYEANNIKHIPAFEEIASRPCRFTDDTVMTCAVAQGIRNAFRVLPADWTINQETEAILTEKIGESMAEWGNDYPDAGYGYNFYQWLLDDKNRRPYNSWGNGSAMRASYAGWVARTLEEALFLAKCSAQVTHNHEEGIKGAQVVAACIYHLRKGATKPEIQEFVSQYYDIGFSLADIRGSYVFDVSCQGSVPQAIRAFLEGNSFEEVMELAISIGGDSDTIAAISGSLAEVIYPIPDKILDIANDALDEVQKQVLAEAAAAVED